jgi:hypothetical protein
MKSDAACHTAKSLLCLFTTTVVLAMFHLISRRIKKMLRQEYVTCTLNSIGYAILQHYFDIFIAGLGRYYMRYFALADTQLITKQCGHRPWLCESRHIDLCLVTGARHSRGSGNGDLNRHPLLPRRETP